VSTRADAFAPERPADAVTALVVVLGCAVLALRVGLLGRSDAGLLLVLTYGSIMVVSLVVPVPAAGPTSMRSVAVVCIAGVLAVAAAAALAGPRVPAATVWWAPGMNVLAAIGEEALFRRAAYGWMARFGPAIAVVATAVLFALVHVPVYCIAALPVDLGAGVLFGWQRAATGSWAVPAATHAVANLAAVIR
jgi:membrane protease YdiL (CAAX protease family)